MAQPDVDGEQHSKDALNKKCPMGHPILLPKIFLSLLTEFGQNFKLVIRVFYWFLLVFCFLARHRILINIESFAWQEGAQLQSLLLLVTVDCALQDAAVELLARQQYWLVFLAHYVRQLFECLVNLTRWNVIHVVMADVSELTIFLQFSQVIFKGLQHNRSLTVLLLQQLAIVVVFVYDSKVFNIWIGFLALFLSLLEILLKCSPSSLVRKQTIRILQQILGLLCILLYFLLLMLLNIAAQTNNISLIVFNLNSFGYASEPASHILLRQGFQHDCLEFVLDFEDEFLWVDQLNGRKFQRDQRQLVSTTQLRIHQVVLMQLDLTLLIAVESLTEFVEDARSDDLGTVTFDCVHGWHRPISLRPQTIIISYDEIRLMIGLKAFQCLPEPLKPIEFSLKYDLPFFVLDEQEHILM